MTTVIFGQGAAGVDPWVFKLQQSVDADNTVTRTSADGATQFVGTFTQTRTFGIVRQLVVLASTVSSGLGGTFVFEYSEDGVTASISESRTIGDFATVRDFDLINAGEYFRVKFTPSRALTGSEMVFITTTMRRQNDGAFVRLANQEIEEANAAMGHEFAYLKAFDAITGKSVNIRPSAGGALRTSIEGSTFTQSGSLFSEGIRDDISLKFSRDDGVAAIATLVNNGSVNGSVTHDAAEGQAVFAVTTTNNSICYYESADNAVYEPGHMIRGGQTIQLSAMPTGNANIQWGWGEDNGSGALLNAIGYGADSGGLYTFRTKAGVQVTKTYNTAFNRDRLDGSAGSRYTLALVPVAINLLNNGIFEFAYEWYGIAPPTFFTTTPGGLPIPVQVEETTGQQTGTTIPEPAVPLFIRISNGTSGQALQVRSGSWRGGVFTNKTILASSTAGATGQLDCGLTAQQVAPGALKNRKSLRLKNLSSSARQLYYGFSLGVTVSNGDELAVGESVDMDIDENVDVYVIVSSTGGGGVRCSWTELS